MTKNVLEWLEGTALRYEEKPAFLDTKDEIVARYLNYATGR